MDRNVARWTDRRERLSEGQTNGFTSEDIFQTIRKHKIDIQEYKIRRYRKERCYPTDQWKQKIKAKIFSVNATRHNASLSNEKSTFYNGSLAHT